MTYLINKYDPCNPLYPTDPLKRQRIDASLFFDSSHLFASGQALMQIVIAEQKMPDKVNNVLMTNLINLRFVNLRFC